MDQQVRIGFKRRLAFAFAVVFAAVAVRAAWQALSSGDPLRLLVVVLAFGGTAAAYVALVLHRDPVLVLDSEGLTDGRRGSVIRWCEVEAAHVSERHKRFDRCHDLILTVGREQTLSVPLDQLTKTWGEVVELVEGRLGKQVSIRREGGLIGRSQARALAS